MPPAGGVRSSLVGMVNAIAAPFRPRNRTGPQSDPSGGRGAPIRSPSANFNPTLGTQSDITQFRDIFQPSHGLFSPSYPLVPTDYERLRRWNFPSAYNTLFTPRSYEAIGFEDLKFLAKEDITALCIETRKDQIEKLEWDIKPRDEDNVKADADTRADKLRDFFRYPNGHTPFATWLRELMHDVLVLDAPTLELRRNRGGDIIALDIIAGETIKVLIDDTGRRPVPPAPAYEQIIHGRPWVLAEDGSRENTDEGEVVAQFTDQQIVYFPRNPRASHAYGYSPVEQIWLTINTSLRRGIMQLQYFTEGNVPIGGMAAHEAWNPEQIRQYQEWFDSKLAGNTAERSRLLVLPHGSRMEPFKEAPLKDDFDEWRARVICYAFSLPPTAFTRQVNRATAATQQEAALEEGLAPLMGWVKRLFDGIIQKKMGHLDLEFAWADEQPMDAIDQAKVLDTYVKGGIQTINEARDALGLDPIEGGDDAMFVLATGPVLVKDVEKMSELAANPPPPPAPIVHMPGAEPHVPNAPAGNGAAQPQRGGRANGKDTSAPQNQAKTPAAKALDAEVGKARRPFLGPPKRSAAVNAAEERLRKRLRSFFQERAQDVAKQVARSLELEGWEKL